jgi:hypothetical protein
MPLEIIRHGLIIRQEFSCDELRIMIAFRGSLLAVPTVLALPLNSWFGVAHRLGLACSVLRLMCVLRCSDELRRGRIGVADDWSSDAKPTTLGPQDRLRSETDVYRDMRHIAHSTLYILAEP